MGRASRWCCAATEVLASMSCRRAFSPDGQRMVTASWDKTVRVWKADGRASPWCCAAMRASSGRPSFSPDGQRIVTAFDDKTARVWKADGSGEPVVLRGHEDSVRSASFSPDGQRIVTASDDQTVRVWNADGRGELLVLHHEDSVRTAASARTARESSPPARTARRGCGRWPSQSFSACCVRPTPIVFLQNLRRTYLDESEAQAQQRYEACERSYGRTPFFKATSEKSVDPEASRQSRDWLPNLAPIPHASLHGDPTEQVSSVRNEPVMDADRHRPGGSGAPRHGPRLPRRGARPAPAGAAASTRRPPRVRRVGEGGGPQRRAAQAALRRPSSSTRPSSGRACRRSSSSCEAPPAVSRSCCGSTPQTSELHAMPWEALCRPGSTLDFLGTSPEAVPRARRQLHQGLGAVPGGGGRPAARHLPLGRPVARSGCEQCFPPQHRGGRARVAHAPHRRPRQQGRMCCSGCGMSPCPTSSTSSAMEAWTRRATPPCGWRTRTERSPGSRWSLLAQELERPLPERAAPGRPRGLRGSTAGTLPSAAALLAQARSRRGGGAPVAGEGGCGAALLGELLPLADGHGGAPGGCGAQPARRAAHPPGGVR